MIKNARILSVIILALGLLLTAFIYFSEKEDNAVSRFGFMLGLDLSGGTQLVYDADTSGVATGEEAQSMDALREVIERRVNLFGVSEPRIQTEKGGLGGEEDRLIVELPGVTDIEEAIAQIGETPLLDFRLQKSQDEVEINTESLTEGGQIKVEVDDLFTPTGLTGSFVERAQVQFDQVTGQAVVVIDFNQEGRQLFSDLTTANVGEVLAIFLDGEPISLPVIQTAITDGTAVISGNFEPEEARELARDLNYGALPIPIELISTNLVGPTLGAAVIDAGVTAGIIGLVLILAFLILWYRALGIAASAALLFYVVIILTLFKLIPVTLTASGIAAFILSVGMAVDANIVIFERIKEELNNKKNTTLKAVQDGFDRAWTSIRDANITSLISAVVLFYFGSSIVKGFALVFGLGILVSMISAIGVSKTFLVALATEKDSESRRALFDSGFRFAKKGHKKQK
ncbi:MAG: protein translocase subunit SecD [Candidatus Paceibacterota bacterium]